MNEENKITTEWKRLADMDLSAAHLLFEMHRPIPVEIVCFHSQQATEKMLKCFLVFKEVEPPKTHDLRELLKMCIRYESGFDNFRKESDTLTDYAVLPRYPAELELNETDSKMAMKYAAKIMDYVNGIVFPTSAAD
ncbi:MAG: HEPN domain-containing protein [Lachnospiraceae bacterium]|jgi:HEPN domain-containing protein|nr:HEPN domain-containing protein [Lachnospiraceae bacterium]